MEDKKNAAPAWYPGSGKQLMFGGWIAIAVVGGVLSLIGAVIGGVFSGLVSVASGAFSGSGMVLGIVIGLVAFYCFRNRNAQNAANADEE